MFSSTRLPTIISVRLMTVASFVSTVPMYLPLRSTATRSESSSTSFSLWVMITIALPSCAHIAQHFEQAVGFLRGQNRGRLVQNQDLCAAIEHLHNLNRLLFRNGHFVNLLERVELEAVFVGQTC